MRILEFVLMCVLFSLAMIPLHAEDRIEPTIEHGASVFNERCTLCHGNVGMGDGLLPRLVDDYPNTNLRKNQTARNSGSIKEAIIYGGEKGTLDYRMPPYGDELTWLEIESLVYFMQLYYQDTEKALTALAANKKPIPPSRERGRAFYKGRCVLCHGAEGNGKGKLSKIITAPPPFNFQYSRLPDNMLQDIITRGGDAVGRSSKMPSFGDELSASDIESIIMYIKGFRI